MLSLQSLQKKEGIRRMKKTDGTSTEDRQNEVIRRYIDDGQSMETISIVCGISESTVWSMINAYRRTLALGEFDRRPLGFVGWRCPRCGEMRAHDQFVRPRKWCVWCVEKTQRAKQVA